MTNKELIALLQERGLKVDSPSNTIPNIYADDLVNELVGKSGTESESSAPAKTLESPKETEKPKKPSLPRGAVVKSAADVAAEREAKENSAKPQVSANEASVEPQEAPVAKEAPKPPPSPSKAAPKVPVRPAAKSPTPPPFPVRPVSASPKESPSQNVSSKTEEAEVPASAGGKVIQCKPPIVVRDFAGLLDMKPFRLISELMEMGIFASMNQVIEEEVAQQLAERHGFVLEIRHRGESQPEPSKKKEPVKEIDESALLEPRPPVICVLGHVDHGKTTLLDTIRKANVVKGEAGGITQHIGAYQVNHNDHLITFLDTPGHAAFSKMRERGANLTDIAILVVAADDAFMPQTDEALKFAQKANVPVVVAINKADARGANIDQVKQQMQQRGIASEDWGGEVLAAPVSALKGEGISELLDLILLQTEMLELKANPKCPAEGIVVESQVEQGRGSTATVIIQKGTLKTGDALACGGVYCKVRAMMDDHGRQLKKAGPSTPVKIIGWSDAPEAGAAFKVVKNDREAKRLAEDNRQLEKAVAVEGASAKQPADLDALFAAINDAQQKVLKVVIKGDVHGSVEALVDCLEGIESDKVKLEVIEAGVGPISQNDVVLAATSDAAVVGFNVKMEQGVQAKAKHHNTSIIQHNIIYELIDRVKDAMADLLDPELNEVKLGAAEVRQTFPVGRGVVAGCMVTEGRITRNGLARILRKGEVVFQSRIDTLKRFKDDANEVRAGYECGIHLQGSEDYQAGDIVECFEMHEVRPSL
tara:strand:+ start:1195 stop:3483 length:2289 start_codon:yes stop_codon:yes gene_type:complete